MTDVNAISYIEENREWTINLLQELVRIPSPVGEEQKIGEYIKNVLKEIGLSAEKQMVQKNRFNVVAKFKKSAEKEKILLLIGHMDTAPLSEGWTHKPFSGDIEDGKLYGLGSSDMKGGIAAFITAIKTLKDLSIPIKGNIVFVAVVDEEAYSKGVLKFLDSGVKADMAILGEPSFDKAYLGCMGKVLVELVFKGKSAHASVPELGINAIDDAAKFINSLKKLKFLRHDKLGKGNYCILKIEGGYKRYSLVVPEETKLIMNRHIVPGESKETVVNDLKSLIESINIRSKVEIKVRPPYYPPYIISKNEPVVKALERAYNKVVGKRINFGYSRSVCDANYMVAQGIPTVVFGPSGEKEHAPDEYVIIEQVLLASKVYTLMIRELLS
ncbi:MAG: M20 family metallopeptidase [Conexivisphaerales archaeon]